MDASNDYRWTNERHLRFLKSVEASFVRTMLENSHGRLLRMDRYLPDSSESTLDSKMTTGLKRRKRHFPADNLGTKVKRLLHPSLEDDQVVPQIKHIKTGDHTSLPGASPSS